MDTIIIFSLRSQEAFLSIDNLTHPLDYISAVNAEVFVRNCFLTGY